MRYLVSIEPDYDRINEIDMSGDVMSLLDWLQETFEAEVMYLEAGRRKTWFVVSFEDAGRLNQLTCVCLYKLGVAPVFRPIFTPAENETAIPASLEFMKGMP